MDHAKKIGIHPFSHDAAVCTINHKKRDVFSLSLERLTRIKHDTRFVGPLLDRFFEITPESKLVFSMKNVSKDMISFFESEVGLRALEQKYEKILNSERGRYSKAWKMFNLSPKDFFRLLQYRRKSKRLSPKKDKASFCREMKRRYGVLETNMVFYDHHFSHACSAYYTAPDAFKDNCVVVTLDGQGDDSFCKIFNIENNIPHEVVTSSNHSSIPLLYSIFTSVAGYIPSSDEGKVEALACYGDMSRRNPLYQLLQRTFYYESNLVIKMKKHTDFPFSSISDEWHDIFIFLEEWKRKLGIENFSAAIQLFLEDFFVAYLLDIRRKNGKKNIAVAGGAFANVKLNLRIVEEGVFDNLYVFPAMGDDGTPLGALLYDDYRDGLDIDWIRDLPMPYFGPSFSRDEVLSALRSNASRITFEYKGKDSYKYLARDILDNKICALFQGRMEFGPRALGHRSILANPANPKIRETINVKFKRREWFQPFCPSVLAEERERLFEVSYPNKHMTCAFTMREEHARALPAIVHVDKTARPQFVEQEDDLYYYNLLLELKKQSGYGVVLNTSYNIHGKAMVLTPQDALDDLFACRVDALYIENFLVCRKD